MNLYRVITFHFNASKLPFLQRVLSEHQLLRCKSKIDIITNSQDTQEINSLWNSITEKCRSTVDLDIISVKPPHRWILPWYSKITLKQRRATNLYSHFMYSEDDLLFTEANRVYFLENLEYLKQYGLYPSFLRVEHVVGTGAWVSSDLWQSFYSKPHLKNILPIPPGPSGLSYINLSNPYQALFLYDQALYDEHESCESFDVNKYGNLAHLNDEWGGGVAERAAFGLTFFRVPHFASSRNALVIDPSTRQIDSRSFVHHLPNNYAHRQDVVSVSSLIDD